MTFRQYVLSNYNNYNAEQYGYDYYYITVYTALGSRE